MELTEEKIAAQLYWWEKSFRYFLKFVKIIEPPSLKNVGGVIDFIMWPHLDKAIDALLSKRLIVWLKSRQIGASWLIAAFALWFALFKRGAVVLLLSKGEDEAIELLGKCRSILTHLPAFFKVKVDPDSRTEMGFPFMDSKIKALSSTEAAGASFTASIIVSDEWDLHPYAIENYTHIKPCIDSSGGQFIGVFTRDPWGGESLAVRTFEDARDGKNGYHWLFDAYDVRPGRDEEWYEARKAELSPEDLRGLTPDLYMLKCYPRSVEEALASPETVSVFDKKALNAMKDNIRSPINIVNNEHWGDIDCSICHIYKDYHIGNHYIAGTDVSLGVGKDYNVTCIMDVITCDIVADILSQYISPEELALHSVSLLKRYHKPLWWIEHNLWGRTVIKKAVELGYRRLGYRGEKPINWNSFGDEELKRVGFFTQDKTRTDLFGGLIPAINDWQITIYNEQGLNQFYGMIINAKKGGRIEASGSGHDDYPIAVGICWEKKSDVNIGEWRPHTVKTLTF